MEAFIFTVKALTTLTVSLVLTQHQEDWQKHGACVPILQILTALSRRTVNKQKKKEHAENTNKTM